MFEKIESLILLGIKVSFKKDIYGFKITLKSGKKKECVVLPYSHLTEFKILNYIDLMMAKISDDEN